jgi:hypothetical protein
MQFIGYLSFCVWNVILLGIDIVLFWYIYGGLQPVQPVQYSATSCDIGYIAQYCNPNIDINVTVCYIDITVLTLLHVASNQAI